MVVHANGMGHLVEDFIGRGLDFAVAHIRADVYRFGRGSPLGLHGHVYEDLPARAIAAVGTVCRMGFVGHDSVGQGNGNIVQILKNTHVAATVVDDDGQTALDFSRCGRRITFLLLLCRRALAADLADGFLNLLGQTGRCSRRRHVQAYRDQVDLFFVEHIEESNIIFSNSLAIEGLACNLIEDGLTLAFRQFLFQAFPGKGFLRCHFELFCRPEDLAACTAPRLFPFLRVDFRHVCILYFEPRRHSVLYFRSGIRIICVIAFFPDCIDMLQLRIVWCRTRPALEIPPGTGGDAK